MTHSDVIITEVLEQLGVTSDTRERIQLPLQPEAVSLVEGDIDLFGRPQLMTPRTRYCWHAMRDAASKDGVNLMLISAYRSVEYQCELIKGKLNKGQLIEDILKVNAPPGYSEHHTGRALDLGTPECEPLSESFEATPAFHWLKNNAATFSFAMTYPRDNPFGIIYEPWHWACDDI